jgi:hypothetical protein
METDNYTRNSHGIIYQDVYIGITADHMVIGENFAR